jgi:PAS domain S-box-containing protein
MKRRERIEELERDNRVLRQRLSRLEAQTERTERIQWATQEARERISRKLIELNEKYRSVVEQTNDGILILSEEDEPRIRFANPALVLMAGALLAEELEGEAPDRLLPERPWDVADETGNEGHTEGVLCGLDGSRRDVMVNLSRITYRDEPARILLIRDITARKDVERRLARCEEENHRLREAMESKGDGEGP